MDSRLPVGREDHIRHSASRARRLRPAEFDAERYRGRNVIERLAGRLKECRRIFSRFEKSAVNYLGMLKLGMIRFYLKAFYPYDFSNED